MCSPGKHQQSSSAAQHGAHTEQDFLVPGSGVQSQATQQQPAAPADRRRSQRSMSQDRSAFPQHSVRSGLEHMHTPTLHSCCPG